MNKKSTLYEVEMERPEFRKKYLKEYKDFELELQMLKAIERLNLTYEEFAKKIGSSKGNVSRDLKIRGLKRASIERIRKMADALGMDFIPLLLLRDPQRRKAQISELLKLGI